MSRFSDYFDPDEFLSAENSTDDPVMTFGKHRGTPISEIDAGYLRWMLKKADSEATSGALVDFVNENRSHLEAVLDPRARVAAIKVDYALTPSQSNAVKEIESTLLMGDTHLMRLEGGAGYGKSFAVLDVVRTAMHHGFEVHACATSYVATQVLAAHLEPYGIEVATIASLMRLEKIEYEDQEEYTISERTYERRQQIFGRKRLLVVDEYSMVNDEIATLMMEAACTLGGKILAVGDLKQLPPVKQYTDTVFAQIQDSVSLTQPMRYNQDSDLYALEQLARTSPRNLFSRNWDDSPEVIICRDTAMLVAAYVVDYEEAPGEDARMLFFRRQDVLEFNVILREMIFGDRAKTEPVIEDEALMVTSTTDVKYDPYEDPVRYYSGTSFLVNSVRETEHLGLPCYKVRFQDHGYEIPVIFGMGTTVDRAARGAEQRTRRLSELREEAIQTGDWGEWRKFKNAFLPVSHRYATTVHRSQGATVDRVYFDPKRLKMSGIGDKLLYVAATRAKRKVYMVKDK